MAERLYRVIEQRSDKKNLGLNYRENFLRTKLSPVLYRNTKVAGFLDGIEGMVIEMIELPKRIKTFYYYSYRKDERDLK